MPAQALIDAGRLAARLDESNVLLLDCRPFLAFNESHVVSAINAYCPSIVRRRARGGRLPLGRLVLDADVRDKLSRGSYYSAIVVYDDEGELGSVPSEGEGDDAMARLALRCLRHDVVGSPQLYLLEGGFRLFHSRFPHLCEGAESPEATFPAAPITEPSSVLDEAPEPVQILGHVFLGSAGHAADAPCLRRLGITAVLNVSRGSPDPSAAELRLHYKCIPIDDSGSADIASWFREAIAFIEWTRSLGGRVLVHCRAGISRSATICLAYLMYTRRLRLDDAYEFVRRRRSVISPNLNFMGQLLRFEQQMFDSSSSSPTLLSPPPSSPASVVASS